MPNFLEQTFQSVLSEANYILDKHSNIWPKADDTRSQIQALIKSVDENEMTDSLTISFVITLLDQLEVLTDELNDVNILDSQILFDIDKSVDSLVNLELTENSSFNDNVYDDLIIVSQKDYHSIRFELLVDTQMDSYLVIQIAQQENVNITLPLSNIDTGLLNNALKSDFQSFLNFIFKTQGLIINGNTVKHKSTFDYNQIFSRLNTIANPQFELSQILSETPELAYTQDFFKEIDLGSNNGQYLLRILRVFSQQLGNCSVMPSLFNLFNMYPIFAQGVEIEEVNEQIICRLLANLNKTRGSSLKKQAVSVLSTYCIDAYIHQKNNIAHYFYNLLLMLEEMEVESFVDLLNLYLDNDFVESYEHSIFHLPEHDIYKLANTIESIKYSVKNVKGFILHSLQKRFKELDDKMSHESLQLLEVIVDSLGKSVILNNSYNFHNLAKIILVYCKKTHLSMNEAKEFLQNSNGIQLNATEFLKEAVESFLNLSASAGFPYLSARNELIEIIQDNPKELTQEMEKFISETLLQNL